MNKLKMTIVMMIGIFFMVGMLGTACAQGSNFSVKADTIEYDMQSGDGMDAHRQSCKTHACRLGEP